MPIETHKSGFADMSRSMPKKRAIRMLSETFRNGSCNRLVSSELIAFVSTEVRRSARKRQPVSAPNGAMSSRAPTATFGHANSKADIRTVR